jgi:hypothetical protein
MKYLASLRAVFSAIITRLGWAGTVQHIIWSGIMPAKSPFVTSFVSHIQ